MKYIRIGSAYQVFHKFEFQTIITGHDIVTDQYHLFPCGKLEVKRYYTWDGSSGGWNTKTFVKGSCIHDILCELINAGLLPMGLQPLVDEQMLIINRKQGMWKLRCLWTYLGVRFYQVRKRHLTKMPKVLEVP